MALALSGSAALAADPPPADTGAAAPASRAEALFQEGKTLLEQGNTAAACDRLAKSDTIDPNISTIGLLAGCHEQQGKIATAWKEYRETVKRAEAAGDSRADFARQRAAALELKIPKLSIHAAHPAPSMEILLSLVRLTPEELAADIPLDPGAYELLVRAPQMRDFQLTVTLKEGSKQVVEIPELVPPNGPPYPSSASSGGEAASSSAEKKPAEPAAPPPAPPSTGISARHAAALVAGGVALVGVGVGSAFGVSAANKNVESTSIAASCTTQAACEKGHALRDDAFKAATISTVSFGVSAVGTVMALVLVLLPSGESEGDKKPASARNVWISPQIGPGVGGAILQGRF